MMVGCDWCISIIVPARSCSLGGPLLYHSPVVFLDRGHPRSCSCDVFVGVDVVVGYFKSFKTSSNIKLTLLDHSHLLLLIN